MSELSNAPRTQSLKIFSTPLNPRNMFSEVKLWDIDIKNLTVSQLKHTGCSSEVQEDFSPSHSGLSLVWEWNNGMRFRTLDGASCTYFSPWRTSFDMIPTGSVHDRSAVGPLPHLGQHPDAERAPQPLLLLQHHPRYCTYIWFTLWSLKKQRSISHITQIGR